MAVLSNTGTATPVIGSETTVAGWTITPPGPLDNISVYFVGGSGGGGGPLLLRLYAEVGGFETLVALKQVVGSDLPSIIAWDTGLGPLAGGGGGGPGGGNATAQDNQVHAGGTAYTLTIEDLSNVPASSSPRQPVTMTIAGVNQFDTAADMNFGHLFALAPGASASLPVFGGYAQFMDVAIDQANIPPFFLVTVTADCGPGSVLGALVASSQMSGTDTTIGAVFRELKLPVATRYFVNITNKSQQTPSIALTGVTTSVAVTSGGAVVLGGDVTGPSGANTDVGWSNIPLNRVGPPGTGSFAAPGGTALDAPIPIYNEPLNMWFAFPLSGGATMNNLGVVTLNPAALPLTGNVNGPANANEWTSFIIEATGAPINLPNPVSGGWTYIGVSGLAGPQMINLPLIPVQGMVVVVTDEDGSLATQSITIDGNGKGVEGAPSLTLNATYPGPKGSVALQYDATAAVPGWFIFADYAKNAASSVPLVGNANGPAGANDVIDFGIEAVNTSVVAAQFVPISAGLWYVGFSALTSNQTLTLLDTFPSGSKVIIKDEDGSFANFDVDVTGSTGDTIDGLATYVLDVASPGPFGGVTIEKNFHGEWSVVTQ